jgi:hypothetical protein
MSDAPKPEARCDWCGKVELHINHVRPDRDHTFHPEIRTFKSTRDEVYGKFIREYAGILGLAIKTVDGEEDYIRRSHVIAGLDAVKRAWETK